MKCLHKTFLQHIAGLLHIAHHAEADVEHRFRIGLVKVAVCLSVALPAGFNPLQVYVVLLVIQTPIRIVVDVMTRQIPKGWNRRNKNRKIVA